jgi:hypothetical protein
MHGENLQSSFEPANEIQEQNFQPTNRRPKSPHALPDYPWNDHPTDQPGICLEFAGFGQGA